MVSLERVLTSAQQAEQVERGIWHKGQADEAILKMLIEDHHKWTGSLRAREILDRWGEARGKFVKVFPHEYRRALGEINAAGQQAGETIAKARQSATPAKVVAAR